MKLSFFVPGHPKTQGSLRPFALKKGGRYTGKVVTPQDSKVQSWRGVVSTYALQAMQRQQQRKTTAPVRVELSFFLLRPKGHFGTGKNSEQVKNSAPTHPVSQRSGDGDKLTRAVWDALTGVVWNDDSQVVSWEGHKTYGAQEGVSVTVQALE